MKNHANSPQKKIEKKTIKNLEKSHNLCTQKNHATSQQKILNFYYRKIRQPLQQKNTLKVHYVEIKSSEKEKYLRDFVTSEGNSTKH